MPDSIIRFGRLTVLYTIRGFGRRMLVCQCDCGNVIARPISDLSKNKIRSCGCLKAELDKARYCTHSLTGTVEYHSWQCMKQRCLNPKNPQFSYYGGRGITICDRWRDSFESFYADMGPRPSPDHSIDRIDNHGPYSPENCRWATRSVQARNSRRARMLTFQGKTMCIAEWAEHLGVSKWMLHDRLKRGWSVERTLSAGTGRRR